MGRLRDDHRIELCKGTEGLYRASCSCGWVSPVARKTAVMADCDADEHLLAVARAEEGR